jgi:hypothetical protein
VAHDQGLLTLQHIQAFETNFAKELYKAADASGLKGTNAEAMTKVRELLKMRLRPSRLRLIPRDDHGNRYTIGPREVHGLQQTETSLHRGDIYKLKLRGQAGFQEFVGEFDTILDHT